MNIMKVANSTKKMVTLFFSLFFLIPYAETNAIRETLTYVHPTGVGLLPSVIVLTLIMATLTLPLFIVSLGVSRSYASQRYMRRCFIAMSLFSILMLIRVFFTATPIKMLYQLVWVVIPFYFAIYLVSIINRLDLDIERIHSNGLTVFTFYLIFNILVNITRYGYSFGNSDPGARSRLISPGGGPVILGYTIAIMLALLLFYQSEFKNGRFVFSFAVMVITSFLTGSRGSMWPVVFLVILFLVDRRIIIRVGLVMILIGIFFINPLEFLREKLPRFFNLLDVSRLTTASSIFEIFSFQLLFEMFFGKGLGTFFPYQEWLLARMGSYGYVPNVFAYHSFSLLVQPHNSYIYLLIETGIIGTVLFCYPIFHSIKCALIEFSGKQSATYKYKVLAVILIAVLNLFDAVFIVAPGSATLWWFVLLSLTGCSKGFNDQTTHK